MMKCMTDIKIEGCLLSLPSFQHGDYRSSGQLQKSIYVENICLNHGEPRVAEKASKISGCVANGFPRRSGRNYHAANVY